MRSSLVRLAVFAGWLGTMGCSSSSNAPAGTVLTDGGIAAVDGQGAPPPEQGAEGEKNPYGAVYPTADIGYNPRRGAVPGNRIANFKFLGYPEGDTSKPLSQVSLADYFDPEGRKYRIIHMVASSVWCGPCRQETEEIVQVKGDLLAKKVVFVQALVDGPVQGRGATKVDLDGWVADRGVNFTIMLDPGVKNLGAFFNAAAVPWNADLDARTMEILSAAVGAPQDISEEVNKWLAWADKTPARP